MAKAQLGDRSRRLGYQLARRTFGQVKGSDKAACNTAEYILTNRIKSRGLPPWVVDMLIQWALELLRKWMEDRGKQTPGDRASVALAADLPDELPAELCCGHEDDTEASESATADTEATL